MFAKEGSTNLSCWGTGEEGFKVLHPLDVIPAEGITCLLAPVKDQTSCVEEISIGRIIQEQNKEAGPNKC